MIGLQGKLKVICNNQTTRKPQRPRDTNVIVG